jgi:hypothetical protein
MCSPLELFRGNTPPCHTSYPLWLLSAVLLKSKPYPILCRFPYSLKISVYKVWIVPRLNEELMAIDSSIALCVFKNKPKTCMSPFTRHIEYYQPSSGAWTKWSILGKSKWPMTYGVYLWSVSATLEKQPRERRTRRAFDFWLTCGEHKWSTHRFRTSAHSSELKRTWERCLC